jgi:5-methyltetrahydrofolate--homocysteine methyltransferase
VHGLKLGDAVASTQNAEGSSPQGLEAVAVLNNVLLPAMKQVGDLFGAWPS